MALSRSEKERVADSHMKLKSVNEALQHVDAGKIPDYEAIQACLENAEESLEDALRNSGGTPGRKQ